jgi:hypothetical protein
MRRIKIFLMSAVVTVAMLVALAGPAMANDRFVDGNFCCDGFAFPRDVVGDNVVFVPIDEDCDFAGTREVDDVTLVFLDCD